MSSICDPVAQPNAVAQINYQSANPNVLPTSTPVAYDVNICTNVGCRCKRDFREFGADTVQDHLQSSVPLVP